MYQNIRKFLETAESDESLKAQIIEIEDRLRKDVDDYITLASKYGFSLTEQDFKPIEKEKLMDEEMKEVSGGTGGDVQKKSSGNKSVLTKEIEHKLSIDEAKEFWRKWRRQN